MSWLWDAAKQAASGDYEGAAETVSEGAQQTVDDAQQAAQDAYDSATDAAEEVVDAVTGAASDAAASGEDALAETLPATIGFLGDVVGLAGIADKTQTLTSDLRDRAESGVDGLTGQFLELNLQPPPTNDGLDDTRDLRQNSDERLIELFDRMIENATSLERDLQDLTAPVTDAASDLVESGSRLAEQFHATNMALIEAIDAEQSGDDESAANHRDSAVKTVDDVTDRLAAAAGRTLDQSSGGRLSDASAALADFERNLDAHRYDDAVTDLERAAERYADAPSAMGQRAGFGDDPVTQLREARDLDPAREAAYAELGAKIDVVLDRGREAGATVDPEDLDARTRSKERPAEVAASRLDDPVVEALTGGHLREAARHVHRAADSDRAGRADEAATATAQARDHADATAPTAAAHLVAVADLADGGHLGDTQVMMHEIRRAVDDHDLERAVERVEEAGGRFEEIAATALTTRTDETVDGRDTRDDVTDGHSSAGLETAERAMLLRERGDDTGAREHADRAGDEYEAAVAALDRNVDLAVHELVGPDASPPARAAATDLLEGATGGNLRDARTQLDDAARSARADDLPRAVESGRRADEHLREAERSIDEHVSDGSLAREVATLRDGHALDPVPDDGDPGADVDDPEDVLGSLDDLEFGAGSDGRGGVDDGARDQASDGEPRTQPVAERSAAPLPTLEEPIDDGHLDEPLVEAGTIDPGIDDEPRDDQPEP